MVEPKLQGDFADIEKRYKEEVAVTTWRPKLMLIGLVIWGVVDAALVIFFLVTVTTYVVQGQFDEVKTIGSIGQNAGLAHTMAVARLAQPILTNDARVLTHDTTTYDMYAVVENPNTEWYATFNYNFTAGQIITPVKEGNLMPGENRYLTALNVKADARPVGSKLVVNDVVWHRIDHHLIADVTAFLAVRNDFQVTDEVYAPDVVLETDTVGRSTFTLKNVTAYSYFSPVFTVLLKRGGVIIGINEVTLSQFVTGEARAISVHWFGDIPNSGTVEVVPMINYFDETVYTKPPSDVSVDPRDLIKSRQ
ncbi:TPA: hypothetical protein DEP96_00715 [Candidatus Uhrbacteria bacterium]|nr:hypothetical protein [Candidatus Uhrbacteria bacterium]